MPIVRFEVVKYAVVPTTDSTDISIAISHWQKMNDTLIYDKTKGYPQIYLSSNPKNDYVLFGQDRYSDNNKNVWMKFVGVENKSNSECTLLHKFLFKGNLEFGSIMYINLADSTTKVYALKAIQ